MTQGRSLRDTEKTVFFSQNHFSIDRAGALRTSDLQPATCKLHPPLSYSFLIDMLHIALTQVDLKSFSASGAVFFRQQSDRASYDFTSNKF